MKHNYKITSVLLIMFLLSQLIGLAVISSYSHNSFDTLPTWLKPVQESVDPQNTLITFVFAMVVGVAIILFLMKFEIEMFFRVWFLLVVIIALSITFNAAFISYNHSFTIALVIAIIFGIVKVFVRDITVHNFTELLIYPGISILFIPLFNLWTITFLLILICAYDVYAVWHAGFMQKMAKYQIQKVRVFSGFFVPYLSNSTKNMLSKPSSKTKKLRVNVAILGGGDVLFPIILSGVVYLMAGLIPALAISTGATIGLAYLFYISEKGQFYPAMPFVTGGCVLGGIVIYLAHLL